MTPLETVKTFMKAIEPLDYDMALQHVSETCEYTSPPPIGIGLRTSGPNCR